MFKRSRHHISGIVVCLLAPYLVGQTGSSKTEPTTAKALQADVDQHINKVTSCLTSGVLVKGDPKSCATLADRMEQLHVPGVSIAVIHNGAIEWARGFGVVEVGGAAVDADTIFQAGSISKPVAAMAALRLVEQKKLALDADVNSELTSWKGSGQRGGEGQAGDAARAADAYGGDDGAWISRLCDWCAGANAGAGAEWRAAGEHTSYSSRK